jgi:hypothetical protein
MIDFSFFRIKSLADCSGMDRGRFGGFVSVWPIPSPILVFGFPTELLASDVV